MPTENQTGLEIFIHGSESHVSGIHEWGDFRLGYFIQKNVGKSQHNEDSLMILANGEHLVFAVADGAGGHPKGKDAAYLANLELLEYAKNNELKNFNPIELIEKMNQRIMDLKARAMTTFSMGLIHQDSFRTLSVGDSEVLYWNSFGNMIYSNIPQSPTGHGIEAGLLKQHESLDDPERHVVNNLLGDPILRVEVASKMQLKKGHTVLVGSDGLFDNLTHDEITEIAAKGVFEKSFETLVQKCLCNNHKDWKKDDDISFIMVRKIKTAELPKS